MNTPPGEMLDRLAIAALVAAAMMRPLSAIGHDVWSNGAQVPAWVKKACCGPSEVHKLSADKVHAPPDGYHVQQAIDAPAWHSEHFPISFWPKTSRPGVLVVESRVGQTTIAALRKRGHIVEVAGPWSEGRLTAASRDGVRRRAAATPRGMQGYAAGRQLDRRLFGRRGLRAVGHAA